MFHSAGCNFGIPFAGPAFGHELENEKWEKLSIKYWILIDDSTRPRIEEQKTLVVVRPELLRLQVAFRTQTSKGSALGNPKPWILKTNKGEWYMELRSPNRVFFCRTNNVDWAFDSQLETTGFHTLLRKMCYEQEKETNPNIKIENIRICVPARRNDPVKEIVVPVNIRDSVDSEEEI